jgi:hypothetical protein
MKRASKVAFVLGLVGLLVVPWMAEANIVIGPGEPDGISPVFPVDNEGRQRETFIAINPANNLNLIMGWNERSAGRNGGQGFVSSFDYGATWGTSGEIFDGPSAASDPAIAISPTGGVLGTAVFNWIQNDTLTMRCRRSFDGGVTFPGPSIVIETDTLGAGIDKNWIMRDPSPISAFLDGMYCTVSDLDGTAASPGEGHVIASYSPDQGATWPVTTVQMDVNGDGLICQGSNVDAFGNGLGDVIVVWWEGTGPTPLPFDVRLGGLLGGAAGPYLNISVNAGGVPAIPLLTPVPGANFYGDMNNNPASPFFNTVYVLSANASAAAVSGGTDPDILCWRYPNGFLPPVMSGPAVRNGIPILNDDGGTADQMFPSITVAPDGTVEVFWLDTRNDPGGSPRARFDIYYTSSVDGGVTWSPNARISPATFTHAGNTFIGDYDDSTTNRGGAPLGGGHTWRSYVVQNASGSGTDPVVQAVNNTAPAAMLTGPTTIDCAGAGVPAMFDASGTVDVDGDPITYTWTITSMFPAAGFPYATNTGNTPSLSHVLPFDPLGGNTYTTTVTATDLFGSSTTANVVTVVSDTTPPMVNSGITRSLLWPARNGMVPAGFTYNAMDDCDPNPAKVVSVYSNEANGAAPYAPDASVLGAQLYLRAERAFPGPGRFYVTRFTATDAAGNASWSCRSSVVPLYAITSHIVALRAQAAAAEAACQASLLDVAPGGAGNTILFQAALP